MSITQSSPQHYISAKLFFNGEFSLGYCKEKPRPTDLSYEYILSKNEYHHIFELQEHIVPDRWGSHPEFTSTYVGTDITNPLLPNRIFNCPLVSQPKTRRCIKGITSFGRRLIRNYSYAISKIYGHKRLGFYTLTLPSVTVEECQAIVKAWRDIVRSFFQRLSRHYSRKSQSGYIYFYVTEIQALRSKSLGTPVPHIHFVAPCFIENSNQFAFSADELRSLWGDTLNRYIKQQVSYESSVDAQIIKKDVTAYISKYISKKKSKQNDYDCPDDFSVGRWYGACQYLRKYISALVIKCRHEVAEMIEYCIHNHLCKYLYPVHIKSDIYGERLCGYSGHLTDDWRDAIYKFQGLIQ